MNAEIVKENLQKLSEVVSFKFPATGWYFSSEEIKDSITFEKKKWICMVMYLKRVTKKGSRVCFSKGKTGCRGPEYYCGLNEGTMEGDPGLFLSEGEGYKKNSLLGNAFYDGVQPLQAKEKYIFWETINTIEDKREIEVVNLFVDGKNLTSLNTLANYDRKTNNNVVIEFSSGCQSLYTLPFKENFNKNPKGVVGLLDPCVRKFLPDDVISFSIPSNRFIEMTNNIKGSFLDSNFKGI